MCGILIMGWVMLSVISVHAQETGEVTPQVFQPKIVSESSVGLEKNIIFKADVSSLPEGASVRSYLWEFGNGQFSSQEEVAHIFKAPGSYNVRLKVSWLPQGGTIMENAEFTKEVFVFERSLFLLTDLSRSRERIDSLRQSAQDQGVYLHLVQADADLRFTGQILKKIEQDLPAINDSEAVMIWSDQVEFFSLLNTFSGRISLQGKDFVVISDGNLSLLRNILNGTFRVLQPERILLTRREAVDEFFTTKEQDVLEVIRNRGYDYDLIDASTYEEVDIFSLGSYAIGYLQGKGVEDSVILLILFLPVVVTFVTFLRLVIGLSTVGGRLPVIFTYAFLVLGWYWGAAVVVVLALISYIFRRYFFKSHLLYTAKVGILTSFLGLVLLFLLGVVFYFDGARVDFSSALMLVMLASMIDRVGGVEGERGPFSLFMVFGETLLISSICFLFISWEWLQVLLLSHPEVMVLFLVANVFMGRFTGLRLMEYFRFREVLKYTEEE